MMHHPITSTRWDFLWTLSSIALVLAVVVTACGGTVVTPAAPTETATQTQAPVQTPMPTPPASPGATLVKLVEGTWTDCTSSDDCMFTVQIQNIGTGCASGTTAAVRFPVWYPPRGQAGPDYPMDAVGGGLAAKTIRPNEIVTLVTVGSVPSSVNGNPDVLASIILLKWDSMTCPVQ